MKLLFIFHALFSVITIGYCQIDTSKSEVISFHSRIVIDVQNFGINFQRYLQKLEYVPEYYAPSKKSKVIDIVFLNNPLYIRKDSVQIIISTHGQRIYTGPYDVRVKGKLDFDYLKRQGICIGRKFHLDEMSITYLYNDSIYHLTTMFDYIIDKRLRTIHIVLDPFSLSFTSIIYLPYYKNMNKIGFLRNYFRYRKAKRKHMRSKRIERRLNR